MRKPVSRSKPLIVVALGAEVDMHGNRVQVSTMLVPEAWERVQDMDPAWRAFYQYHAGLSEPWDGPAALSGLQHR